MSTIVVTILQFAISLSLLMFFHELGHFLVSRLFKIEVEEFGFGFPPRMLKLFTVKGTLFSLNWIPFGAFVRPKGENDPSVPGGMASAKAWKRLLVLLAGPVMNLLVGIVIMSTVISRTGAPDTSKVQIVQILPASPAETSGMQVGDMILKVAGQTISGMDQVGLITKQNLGKSLAITVLRNDKELSLSLIPRLNPPEGEGPMGIAMNNPIVPVSWFRSVPVSFSLAGETILQVVTLPIKLIRGEIPSSQARLVSPLGLYDIYSQVRANQATTESITPGLALTNILWFFANISILLGVSNLLPIPAVDGGRILFLLPELIFKKRIPVIYENIINTIGFFLLLALMAFLFIQDIVNPVVLP